MLVLHLVFVFAQGTLTEDRTLASHHIYPLAASTEEGQFKFVYVCALCSCYLFNTWYLFNFIHIRRPHCFQMNGCVQSCGKINMSWYTGELTLTGNVPTHTQMPMHKQNMYLLVMSPVTFEQL